MNRIKEVLKEKGISQTWLAKKLDKSYNSINEYSRNVRQPSIEDLYRIAKILDVNAKDLLKEEWVKKTKATDYRKKSETNAWNLLTTSLSHTATTIWQMQKWSEPKS